MGRFESDPPGLEPLASAIIGKCTDAERQFIGRMAVDRGMTTSQFVRFATLRYSQMIIARAENMTLADVAIEESRQRAAIDAERVKVAE